MNIMSQLHFQPIKGQAYTILETIMSTPEISSCHEKDIMFLRLACEEIVMNVTAYAYPERDARVSTEDYLDIDVQKVIASDSRPGRIIIRFEDGGVPFNPLEQEEPDTTLSWEDRQIGGLGILLVRRRMDDVRYAYVDHKNVLTIEKYL